MASPKFVISHINDRHTFRMHRKNRDENIIVFDIYYNADGQHLVHAESNTMDGIEYDRLFCNIDDMFATQGFSIPFIEMTTTAQFSMTPMYRRD